MLFLGKQYEFNFLKLPLVLFVEHCTIWKTTITHWMIDSIAIAIQIKEQKLPTYLLYLCDAVG